jgi:lipoyl synthase
MAEKEVYKRKPEWLRIKTIGGKNRTQVEKILSRLSLHTVCEEANCPNIMECFSNRTATFMILGSMCTRNCRFCNVSKGKPQTVDIEEPLHVAKAVKDLGLLHVVITSVTRDDLPDGGAEHFANVINKIREQNENVAIEVLIPDLQGNVYALKTVVDAKPDIIGHNIETVPRLYSNVRPMAVYERSLEVLKNIKSYDDKILTKSGIMLGLGETWDEVVETLKDLRKVGCDLLTVGQYIAPSLKHHPVIEYIHPDVFEKYRDEALNLGFKYVASGPLVRSSYHAEKAMEFVKA